MCSIRVGMTQRVPSVLKPLPGSGTKQSMGRKRSITPCPPVKEPLAEFIRNTCELCCHMYMYTLNCLLLMYVSFDTGYVGRVRKIFNPLPNVGLAAPVYVCFFMD